MNKLKFTIILLLFISNNFYSQENYLDFIVTQTNDTIYGTIRNNFKKLVFIKNNEKGNEKEIMLKNVITFRYNDQIFKNSKYNSLYEQTNKSYHKITTKKGKFINIVDRKQDYIITKRNDTIYGFIQGEGNLKFIDKSNNTYRLSNVNEYRFNNEIYRLKKKRRTGNSDKKNDFLRLVYNGEKAKLYEIKVYKPFYENLGHDYFYYVEKDNETELILINKSRFYKIINRIFNDNSELLEKVNKRIYTQENLYLIVKYYNENE